MAKKKAKKKARTRRRDNKVAASKCPEWSMKVCPVLSKNCVGPSCRLWISPDDSENGECIILLAGLRLLAGDDETFSEVTKNLIQQIATEGGKGIATLFRSVLGDMLSKFVKGTSVSPEETSSSAAGTGSPGLRGVEAEE